MLFFASFAVGVGNDEHAVAPVRGANGGSRDAIPFRVIPARGQVPEYPVQSPRKEGWNVFHDDDARSNHANDPGVFAPQAGPLSVDTRPGTGDADILAGEPPADDINAPPVGVGWGEGSNVIVPPHVGPVLRQHLLTERVDLHLPLAPHPRALEPQVEPTDAREQGAES